jgi:hypothetical protein
MVAAIEFCALSYHRQQADTLAFCTRLWSDPKAYIERAWRRIVIPLSVQEGYEVAIVEHILDAEGQTPCVPSWRVRNAL